ncbi:MAG TPA: CsgG/HfaB family protein, partial [Acidobacteriota bacterium]
MSDRIRRLAAAVACVVLAAVAGMAPAAGTPAPSQEKVRIAVMNFENNSQWHWWGNRLGEAAADELVTQLFQTGKFSVVER